MFHGVWDHHHVLQQNAPYPLLQSRGWSYVGVSPPVFVSSQSQEWRRSNLQAWKVMHSLGWCHLSHISKALFQRQEMKWRHLKVWSDSSIICSSLDSMPWVSQPFDAWLSWAHQNKLNFQMGRQYVMWIHQVFWWYHQGKVSRPQALNYMLNHFWMTSWCFAVNYWEDSAELCRFPDGTHFWSARFSQEMLGITDHMNLQGWITGQPRIPFVLETYWPNFTSDFVLSQGEYIERSADLMRDKMPQLCCYLDEHGILLEQFLHPWHISLFAAWRQISLDPWWTPWKRSRVRGFPRLTNGMVSIDPNDGPTASAHHSCTTSQRLDPPLELSSGTIRSSRDVSLWWSSLFWLVMICSDLLLFCWWWSSLVLLLMIFFISVMNFPMFVVIFAVDDLWHRLSPCPTSRPAVCRWKLCWSSGMIWFCAAVHRCWCPARWHCWNTCSSSSCRAQWSSCRSWAPVRGACVGSYGKLRVLVILGLIMGCCWDMMCVYWEEQIIETVVEKIHRVVQLWRKHFWIIGRWRMSLNHFVQEPPHCTCPIQIRSHVLQLANKQHMVIV